MLGHCRLEVVVGDALRHAVEVLERAHGLYGLTETGGCYVVQPLTALAGESSAIPIGHPVAGAKLYLLDEYMEPVPQNVLGEIYVSSRALARGYYQQPGRTARVFVPDPFSDSPGARLCRTSAVACLMSDGSLEYRGRRDGCLDLRGLRIEMEEIEAALIGHESVSHAVAVARDLPDLPDPRIAAFVVAADGQFLITDDLRDFLQELLPVAMLPATYTLLETLPLNRKGEVDRRALLKLAADNDNIDAAPPYVAPSNEIEEQLASIWAQTLGIDHIGVNDNFFRLGGHSLLATQVVARISDVFQVDLPLTRLFEMPTLAEIARVIGQLTQMGGAKSPSIGRVTRQGISLPIESGSAD